MVRTKALEAFLVRTAKIKFCAAFLFGLQIVLFFSVAASGQDSDSVEVRLRRIMDRPEYAHANFGIEFYALDTDQVLYSVNANKLFTPASTTKTLTEGALLASLGPEFRFHTKVFHTGHLDSKGHLKGDLILVASGDPDLSGRIQPDETLAFQDEDHSYGGPAVTGDPLAVIKELAKAVAAKGVRRIDGRVLIDTSLFPDGSREGGTQVVRSSIMVNDNLVDLVATPGSAVGDPVSLQISPQTGYARFDNQLVTSAAGSKPTFHDPVFVDNPNGTTVITLTGTIPVGSAAQTAAIPVPSPTLFAETVFREALAADGIKLKQPLATTQPDFISLNPSYLPENLVAEHVSPPLKEEIKLTLKVSQNLHASMGQFLLGSLVAHDKAEPEKKGFQVEREFLRNAHLDLSGASQGDGEGGDWADLFSPDFMCHYMAYWATRPDFDIFFRALPVLGKDGTLAKIQVDSPAAGHVFAKTGTYDSADPLNGRIMLNGKGLVGYVYTKSGRKLAFAAYVNHVALPDDPDAAQQVAGQALGAIAAAAYDGTF